VTKSFSGDIEGEGTLEYLMAYREDGSASFVGLERVEGGPASAHADQYPMTLDYHFE
jgi:hypothetical protein